MAELREARYPERDRDPEGRAFNQRPRDRYGAPLPRDARDQMPDRVEPEDVVDDVDDALGRAVRLFDEQRFFEAHEFFEWIWKTDDVAERDRAFWKGVAQLAVGCTHTQRGNAKGAVTLLERAADAVAPYPSPHHGIDVRGLVAEVGSLVEVIRSEGATPEAPFPRFPLAP